jgi:hypothetical protein
VPAPPAGLASYLLGVQREFLEESARRAGANAQTVLKNLKVDPAILKTANNSLSDLGLIYPDIVPGG